GQVAAMSTAPGTGSPHRVTGQRNSAMAQRFGLTAAEQLTNGFHVHVAIESVEEGIIALDRIRIWLHLLLALRSNSPYWNGKETSFASYRYQVWSRWPTSGPRNLRVCQKLCSPTTSTAQYPGSLRCRDVVFRCSTQRTSAHLGSPGGRYMSKA